MGDSFTHLHVHTEFSMLDGAARIGEVVAAAAADGQPAIGITDHGNMYGVLDFYKACQSAGHQADHRHRGLHGRRAAASSGRRAGPRRRHGRRRRGRAQKLYYHLTLLAETNAGYRNLIQLSSRAYLEGYYYKPRVDWELLERHHEGLIATTGCLGGHVLQALLHGRRRRARSRRPARLQDIFGRDNLFVELQDHGIPEQHAHQPAAARDRPAASARRCSPPTTATTPTATTPSPTTPCCACRPASLMSDPEALQVRRRRALPEDRGRDAPPVRARCPRRATTRCGSPSGPTSRSSSASRSCPTFPLPEGFADDADYLAPPHVRGRRASGGATRSPTSRRAPRLRAPGHRRHGLLSSYFLIVWDLIQHARDNGIRVGPGRGVGGRLRGGLLPADHRPRPDPYDLLFERFLNPSRISMPDIDMDFDSRYRDEMIRYAAERYGRDHVAQIVTFSTIKARAAVRDAARVLGYPYVVGDKIAKAMPPLVMGRDTPLYACLEQHRRSSTTATRWPPSCAQMYDADPDAKQGHRRGQGPRGPAPPGRHPRRRGGDHQGAAHRVPARSSASPRPGRTPRTRPIVTQYEMHGVEELGLLKMDFLGLRNLDVITDTARADRATPRASTLDIDNVAARRRRRPSSCCSGATRSACSSSRAAPMRALMRSLAPDQLRRRRRPRRAVPARARWRPTCTTTTPTARTAASRSTYLHPDARGGPRRHLRADDLPGVGDAGGPEVRRLLAGRGRQPAQGLRQEDPRAHGQGAREVRRRLRDAPATATQLGTQLFDIIEPFADYAFNKCHAYGYGLVAYQTAYLKAHYPVEYLAALLTSVKDNLDKAAVYLAECRHAWASRCWCPTSTGRRRTSSPCSTAPTTAHRGRSPSGCPRCATSARAWSRLIVAEREANGPFADFYDFCERVDPTVLNKRTIESLIKAGGFDSLGHPRQGLLAVFEQIVDQHPRPAPRARRWA